MFELVNSITLNHIITSAPTKNLYHSKSKIQSLL